MQQVAPVRARFHRLARVVRQHRFDRHLRPTAADRLVQRDDRGDVRTVVEHFALCLREQHALRIQHAVEVEVSLLVQRVGEVERSLRRTLYQEGYLDFDRVLDAQRVLFTQTEREVLNDSAHIAAVITMYKAVGGGWTEMPMEEIVPNDTRETMEARTNWGDLLREPLPTEADTPEQGPPGSDTK